MTKRNFGFLRKFSIIFLAFFLTFLITGCDPNTKEKKRLTTDIEYIRTEIDKEIVQSHKILVELKNYKNKISDLEDRKSLKEAERKKWQYDFGKYVLDHQTVIVSLIAAGSEVGPMYCILHPNEYAEVTARIAWFGKKLSNINDEISTIDIGIYELKQKLGLLEQKHNEYEESIDALKARLSQKQEKFNSF
jgi:peptidoglycan hydrolase CwlO-like protein